uniref:L-ectoine synthase n=1 Tax=Magnetococcus massalia (strain MO-1) TaxID=451514 RepID=A0A1S7LLW8_MAGMO|nr:putative ectoine synthase [Candidatus Magnetococcus massalia]
MLTGPLATTLCHRCLEPPSGHLSCIIRVRVGVSFHKTTIRVGTETSIHYHNHLEVVYSVGGRGEVKELESGILHPIKGGIL